MPTVQLLSSKGVRIIDVPEGIPYWRVAVPRPIQLRYEPGASLSAAPIPYTYREFERVDAITYVEKE